MELRITTSAQETVIDITERVEDLLDIEEGLCHIHAKHATAAIIVNESADPELGKDLLDSLELLFPKGKGYRHDRIDDNAHAHLKAALLGPGETIPVREGRLALGTWQAIMLVELDGPRERLLEVTTIKNDRA